MAWQSTLRQKWPACMCVCVCVCVLGRKTERENNNVGSEALRLSYLISLIRTQTITVPWLSSLHLIFFTHQHSSSLLSYTLNTLHPSIYPSIHLFSLQGQFELNPECKLLCIHYIVGHSSRMYQYSCWVASKSRLHQSKGPLRVSCFEWKDTHPGKHNSRDQAICIIIYCNDLKLFS